MTDAQRRSFLRGRFSAMKAPAAAATPAVVEKLVVSHQCLAQHRIECRACGDVCDARAIRFRPAPGGIAQMLVDAEACTACGDCVPLCPVGAIVVTPPAPMAPSATA